jgi:hypothetical protein
VKVKDPLAEPDLVIFTVPETAVAGTVTEKALVVEVVGLAFTVPPAAVGKATTLLAAVLLKVFPPVAENAMVPPTI